MAKTTGIPIALVALLLGALGWSGDATAATTCSTCHAPVGSTTDIRPVDAAYRNISTGGFKGSHVKHIPAATIAATDCVVCHGAAVASYTVNHRNGSIEISGVGYSKGATFTQSGNPVLGSCNAASCHDDGKGTLVTTPTWGTTAPPCSVCHAAVPATNSHSKHLSGTLYKTAVCADCHNGTVQSTTANPANHRNGTIDVYKTTPGDLGYPANKVKGSALATCATSYCHSSGQSDNGLSATPVYATTPPTWGAAVACGSCHTTTTRTSGSHAQHISQTIDCGKCHSGATATAYNATTHVDGKIDVAAGFAYANQGAPGNGYSSCSATICHGSGAPTWGATATVPVSGFPYSTVLCETCHGSATTNPFYSTAIPKNSLTTDAKTGAHTAHLSGASNISSAIACLECHTVPATTNASGHMDGTAQLTFGTLAKSQTTSATSCATTWCHGGNTTLLPQNSTARTAPVWNAPFVKTSVLGTGGPAGTSGSGYCAQCHGYPPLTANHTAKTASTCIGCHPHLNADALTFNDKTKHINGTIDAAGHSFPYPGASHLTAAGTTPWTACTGCHTNSAGGTYPVTAGTAPNCTGCHRQGLKTPSGTSSCYDCHGSSATNGQPNGAIGTGIGGSTFPNYSGSHSAHVTKLALTCSNCHNGYGAGTATHGNSNRTLKTAANIAFSGLASTPTFTTPATCTAACHVAATWGSRLGCINCHSVAITRTKGRPGTQLSAVTTEFGLAWGHKKTGRGAVTDADCIVCHLEGNGTTLRTSTYHGDGNIDLRDPDGAGETPISNISGAAFTFQRFSTSYAAGSRTATGHTSNTDIANVLSQKFCIRCHDANGATNTTARTTGGTAFMPFGGINLGANYTVANGAASAGGLVDVATQFAITNSSAHPLLGPKNRDFPTAARMNDPYKPTGTRGTAGTLSTGVVLNCFDCHNVTGTPLTTRSVAAHGNAVTIRGTATISGTPSTTNAVTLCKVCHAGYDTSTSSNHATGSAFSGSTDSGMTNYLRYGCNICHSSGYTTAVARPVRAQDVHGVNVLPTGGIAKTGRWSGTATGTPATVNARPYAFIRNTQVLPNHVPKKIGAVTYTTSCMGGNVSPCSQGTKSYSVGGTY